MPADSKNQIVRLLAECSEPGGASSEELLPLVYDELRKLAASRMAREAPGITLQPTALVHEAYLRLIGDAVEWDGAGHFFAAAAESMRRILVDQARARSSLRRGGRRQRVDLEHVDPSQPDDPGGASLDSEQILAVNAALSRIDERDPRMAEVVKLRFFAGLSIDETARAMGVSDRTVRREWTFAKAWFTQEFVERTLEVLLPLWCAREELEGTGVVAP
jgi:RNA polymerase sigma factor (TIGR02999 family)